MKKFAIQLALIGALLVAAVIEMACYKTTDPPPCANIENCDNPADVPPIWDRHAPDGGSKDGGPR